MDMVQVEHAPRSSTSRSSTPTSGTQSSHSSNPQSPRSPITPDHKLELVVSKNRSSRVRKPRNLRHPPKKPAPEDDSWDTISSEDIDISPIDHSPLAIPTYEELEAELQQLEALELADPAAGAVEAAPSRGGGETTRQCVVEDGFDDQVLERSQVTSANGGVTVSNVGYEVVCRYRTKLYPAQ